MFEEGKAPYYLFHALEEYPYDHLSAFIDPLQTLSYPVMLSPLFVGKEMGQPVKCEETGLWIKKITPSFVS
jgi:hypothetical protein